MIHSQSLTIKSNLYEYATCALIKTLIGKQLPRKGTENLQLAFKHKMALLYTVFTFLS